MNAYRFPKHQLQQYPILELQGVRQARHGLSRYRSPNPLSESLLPTESNIFQEVLKLVRGASWRGKSRMSGCIMVNHIAAEETRSLSHATLDFLPSSVHCPAG